MTDRELTKAAISIYRKACRDMEILIESVGVPVYSGSYGMRRWLKHNDDSCRLKSGKEIMHGIMNGNIGFGAEIHTNCLTQATPKAVARMRKKITKDIVEDCRRDIKRAADEIVKNETAIKEIVRSGKLTVGQFRKIISKTR